MKVLLTGSTGYLGIHLRRRLQTAGYPIACVVRQHSRLPESDQPSLICIPDDPANPDPFREAIFNFNPDVTIHLAALSLVADDSTRLDDLVQSNIGFGLRLIEALRPTRCRQFITTGTFWQHSMNGGDLNLYAASKSAFDQFLRYYHEAIGLSVITLKLFDTYGPADPRPKILNLILKALTTHTELGISPAGQELDLVFIEDVADAYTVALNRLQQSPIPLFEDFGIGTGTPLTLQEIISVWETVARQPLPVRTGARPYRDREVMQTWKTFNRLPGWSPRTSLADGLLQMMQAAGITPGNQPT